MKLQYLVFAILLMFRLSFVHADDLPLQKNVLVGDFEGTGLSSQLISEKRSDGLDVSYFSPSLRRSFHYFIAKFDECSSMVIYAIPRTRNVAIDGSCSSQGGQIFTNVYQWKPKLSNWCLIREVTGERADDTSGRPKVSNSVSHTTGCILIGESRP